MPQQDVVRGSQILLEGLWSMMQDGLTCGKEVMIAFYFPLLWLAPLVPA